MQDLDTTPVTQDYEPDASGLPAGTGSDSDPLLAGGESPATADQIKRRNDLLAQQGRELAAEKRRRESAEQAIVQSANRLAAVEAQLQNVSASVSARDQAEMDTYLQSLPPDQRHEMRVQMLEERLAQADQRENERIAAAQRVDYQRQRTGALIAQASQHFGVAITGQEPELVWTSEPEFIASLRALGSTIQRYGSARGEGTPMATKKPTTTTAEQYGLTPAQYQKIKTEALQEVGAGRSMSPRPAGGASGGAPSEDDVRDAGWAHSSKNPGKAKQAFADMRERAAKANGVL